MKDASHFAMWQKPDEFNATVLEFLAGSRGRWRPRSSGGEADGGGCAGRSYGRSLG